MPQEYAIAKWRDSNGLLKKLNHSEACFIHKYDLIHNPDGSLEFYATLHVTDYQAKVTLARLFESGELCWMKLPLGPFSEDSVAVKFRVIGCRFPEGSHWEFDLESQSPPMFQVN